MVNIAAYRVHLDEPLRHAKSLNGIDMFVRLSDTALPDGVYFEAINVVELPRSSNITPTNPGKSHTRVVFDFMRAGDP